MARADASSHWVVATGAVAAELTWRMRDGELEIDIVGDVCTVSVNEICPAVVHMVERERPRLVTIDGSGVTFVDARAITLLVVLAGACAEHGAGFRLRSPSREFARLLELCGMTNHEIVGPDLR